MSAQSVIQTTRPPPKQKVQGSFMMPSQKLPENKFGNLSQSVMLGSNPQSSLIRRNSTPLMGASVIGQQKIKPPKDIREAEGFDDLPATYKVKDKDSF
jgi:hypothetical protein